MNRAGSLRERSGRSRFPRSHGRERGSYVVFYDAGCRLCRWARRGLERLGGHVPMRFMDANDRRAVRRWLGIAPQLARREVQVLDPAGHRWSGYQGTLILAAAVWPWMKRWLPLLRRPTARTLGQQAYHWVSDRRHRISDWLPQPPRETAAEPSGTTSRTRTPTPKGERVMHHRGRHRGGHRVQLTKAGLAGGIGGLAGAWMMNQLHTFTLELKREREVSRAHARDESIRSQPSQGQPGQSGGEKPATVKAAEKVAEPALERDLTRREERAAGPTVHYGLGAVLGMAYGVMGEVLPMARSGTGLVYGAVAWFLSDEVAVPATGLADPPHRQPPGLHARALGAHLVFGVTTESVFSVLRTLLGRRRPRRRKEQQHD